MDYVRQAHSRSRHPAAILFDYIQALVDGMLAIFTGNKSKKRSW